MEFMSSGASGWAQAIGAVLAILATAHIARSDQRRKDEHALIVAEFTTSRLAHELEEFNLSMGKVLDQLISASVADCAPETFGRLLEVAEQNRAALRVEENDLVRLAVLPKSIPHDVVDVISAYNGTIHLLRQTSKSPKLLQISTERRERAKLLAISLQQCMQLADKGRFAMLNFLKKRGVAINILGE
jgi:hypothetical protein